MTTVASRELTFSGEVVHDSHRQVEVGQQVTLQDGLRGPADKKISMCVDFSK
jgi:hypothetical protein